MCDLRPSFKYEKKQREQFRKEAEERREHAVQYRIGEFNETREQAEGFNRRKNHFMGVLSECAVGKWLDDEDVRYTVPDNMYLEILRKIPDITTEDPKVTIDVKSSVDGGYFYRFSRNQIKDDQVVVWVQVRWPVDCNWGQLDEVVPEHATILGWSKIREVRAGDTDEDNYLVDPKDVRCLATLLDWLKNGMEPK